METGATAADAGERGRGDTGGGVPPWRKTRTYLTSNLKVRTYCHGESMENIRITTMGFTWMEESQTTLYGNVVGGS